MSSSGSKRTATGRWAKFIAESASPVFAVDSQRKLVLFNHGGEEATGWPAEELLGRVCEFVSEADAQSREAVLAACGPPAEVWQGRDVELPCVLPHRGKPARTLRVRFHPLLDADGRVELVFGQFIPATDETARHPSPAFALHAELAALRQRIRERYREGTFIGSSPPIRRVLAQLAQAAKGNSGVLIVGESGVGKEHLARMLHQRGPHAALAFVPVDCSRTDAAELKRIIKQMRDDHRELEALRAGALYLKEVSAAPRDVQERLAEWLTARKEAETPRVVASCAIDLKPLVDEDRFLPDLYFELTTTVIELPPLCRRLDDISLLSQHVLDELNRGSAKPLSGFAPETMDHLRRYRWPGNVGELQRVIQAAATQTTGPQIQVADLPLSFRLGEDAQRLPPTVRDNRIPLDDLLARIEREQIESVLVECRGNLSRAAELLGWSRPKLYRRLEALGLLPDAQK